MKNKIFGFIIGLLFLAGCAACVASLLFDISLSVFLAGWWTVFLIVPGLLGLFSRGSRIGSFGLLILGLGLLAREQDKANGLFGGMVSDITFWQMLLPVVLLVTGLSIITSVFGLGKAKKCVVNTGVTKSGDNEVSCTFSSQRVDYESNPFTGGEFTCVFGELYIDLSNAVIENDCELEVNGVFGKVTVKTGGQANFRVKCDQVFGSVKNTERIEMSGLPVVSVDATAVFGEVQIV